MPVETATYLSDLVPANPATNDPVQQGQQHLQIIKRVLQATFPSLKGAVTASDTQLSAVATLLGTGAGASVTLTSGTANPSVSLTATPTGVALSVTPAVTTAVPTPATVQTLTSDATGVVAATVSLNAPSILQAGNPLVPSGLIALWSGASTAIPAGWLICDGTNNTPDLRDRFIVGAGLDYGVGQTGGAATQTGYTSSAGAHSHGGQTASGGGAAMTASTDVQGAHSHGGQDGAVALTVDQLPPHTHGFNALLPGAPAGLAYGSGTGYSGGSTTASTGSGLAHSHSISTDGAHGHNVTVSSVPAHQHGITTDGTHQHMISASTVPPYYALAYIMKS